MIILSVYRCDRCSRKNAFPIMLPMKKDENEEIIYEHIDLCGPCAVKMAQHLFASKLPSKEKELWLSNFIKGIIK